MARTLERELPERPAVRRYPWSEWCDGRSWQITEGEDYETPTDSMRIYLYQRARKIGMRVTVRKTTERGAAGLAFRFYAQEA